MSVADTIGCLEAEVAVLGALLLAAPGDTTAVAEMLEPEDFVDPRHRVIFEAVVALLELGVSVDPVTVLGRLRRTGAERSMTADRSAGAYVADLLGAAPAVVAGRHYALIVLEHRARRRLAEAAERLGQVAGTASLPIAAEVARDEWAAVLRHLARAAATPPEARR